MEKTDLRKDLKRFYTAKEKPEIIEVPEAPQRGNQKPKDPS